MIVRPRTPPGVGPRCGRTIHRDHPLKMGNDAKSWDGTEFSIDATRKRSRAALQVTRRSTWMGRENEQARKEH